MYIGDSYRYSKPAKIIQKDMFVCDGHFSQKAHAKLIDRLTTNIYYCQGKTVHGVI